MASRRGSRRGSDQPPLERDTTRRSHLAGPGEYLLALCARPLVREENQAEPAWRGISVSLRRRRGSLFRARGRCTASVGAVAREIAEVRTEAQRYEDEAHSLRAGEPRDRTVANRKASTFSGSRT